MEPIIIDNDIMHPQCLFPSIYSLTYTKSTEIQIPKGLIYIYILCSTSFKPFVTLGTLSTYIPTFIFPIILNVLMPLLFLYSVSPLCPYTVGQAQQISSLHGLHHFQNTCFRVSRSTPPPFHPHPLSSLQCPHPYQQTLYS